MAAMLALGCEIDCAGTNIHRYCDTFEEFERGEVAARGYPRDYPPRREPIPEQFECMTGCKREPWMFDSEQEIEDLIDRIAVEQDADALFLELT
jgi:hypothetical protein